jgi:hypothetical protein
VTYTPAQIGAASDPSAHAATATTGTSDGHNPAATPPASTVQPEARRSFRLSRGRMFGGSESFPGTAGADVAGTIPAAHAGLPTESWRAGGDQNPESYPVTIDELAPVAGEQISNTRAGGFVRAQSAPDRTRAGSTGADTARAAVMPRWIFTRPWDKGAAEHPAAMAKIEQGAPLASRPLRFSAAVPGGVPSAGGNGSAPGMGSIGSQPNSVRLMPQPWDELALNTGGLAADVVADPARAAVASRGRSFRG